MLWLALIHGANGMRTIVNDYVTHPSTARGAGLGARGWPPAFLIVLGTLVVFTFDPCLGVDRRQHPLGAVPAASVDAERPVGDLADESTHT